ncbi:hypothetical protein ILYODFUR_032817 [Ilyodon furcidens]|uniref:Uncharacterized protein n=1 Tax=Ilyodon furcidens TaxID=33524 RepID=A0ABV0TD78_9TELE
MNPTWTLKRTREQYSGTLTIAGLSTVYPDPGAVHLRRECRTGQCTRSRKRGCDVRAEKIKNKVRARRQNSLKMCYRTMWNSEEVLQNPTELLCTALQDSRADTIWTCSFTPVQSFQLSLHLVLSRHPSVHLSFCFKPVIFIPVHTSLILFCWILFSSFFLYTSLLSPIFTLSCFCILQSAQSSEDKSFKVLILRVEIEPMPLKTEK